MLRQAKQIKKKGGGGQGEAAATLLFFNGGGGGGFQTAQHENGVRTAISFRKTEEEL